MDKAKLYTLKVLALTKDSGEKEIVLPPLSDWDNSNDWISLCDEINSLEENFRKEVTIKADLKPAQEQFEKYRDLLKNVYKVIVYVAGDTLPVDYLWLNGKLLLKDSEKLDAAVSAKLPGIARVQTLHTVLRDFKMPISSMVGQDEKVEEYLELLSLAAAYNILTGTDNAPINVSNRNIAYEFLQNADDSKRRNVGEGETIQNDFSVTAEGDKITLRYSEPGFSLWDFYCVICRGSSGNDNIIGNTGHFGTGFKSIYSLCNKVVITGGNIECTLAAADSIEGIPFPDDKDIALCLNSIGFFNSSSNIVNRNKKSPVPQFTKAANPCSGTTICLHFTDIGKKDAFYEELKNPANYVFLKNLDYPFEISEQLKGDYYPSSTQQNGMPLMELYFTKTESNPQDSLHPFYCTLPMHPDNDEKFPFFINLPLIKTTETRDDFVRSTDIDEGKYNRELFAKIFGENGEFLRLFEKFAENNPDRAYKFFPYSMYKKGFSNIFPPNIIETLKKIRFIPCVNNNGKLCSIADIISGKIRVFTDSLYARLANTAAIESVAYVEGEAAEFLAGQLQLYRAETVLDRLGLLEDSAYNELVENIMQYNRLNLYYDDIAGKEDALLDTLTANVPLDRFKVFWSELENCSLEKRILFIFSGKVVYESTAGSFHFFDYNKLSKVFSKMYYYFKNDGNDIRSDRIIVQPRVWEWLPEWLPKIGDFIRGENARQFFLRDDDEALIKQVIVKIPDSYRTIWNLLLNANEEPERCKKLYSWVMEYIEESNQSIELSWGDGIERFLDSRFFYCAKKTVFVFESGAVRYSAEKNRDLFHLYMKTVAQEKRQDISKEFSIFADDPMPADKNACEIRFRKIQKYVTGFVKGRVAGEEKTCIVLLFGEGKEKEALNKFLINKCDCSTFALAKTYKEMLTLPIDESAGFCGNNLLNSDEDLTPVVKRAAELIVKRNILNDSDRLAKGLIGTFHVDCGEDDYEFSGYGRYRYATSICPVCGGKLLIESSATKLGGILVNKTEFPLLMCLNCYSSLNYIKETELQYCCIDDKKCSYEDVKNLSSEDINRFFRKAGFRLKITFANVGPNDENISKTVDLKMTFLHKVILYMKLFPESDFE